MSDITITDPDVVIKEVLLKWELHDEEEDSPSWHIYLREWEELSDLTREQLLSLPR